MFSKALLAAAAVSIACAQLPGLAKRDFLLQDRQDQDQQQPDDKCQSAITSVLPLYDSLPTPPPALLSVTIDAHPCATPTFTGEAAAEYSFYTSEVLGWYASNSAKLNGALASCSDLASYASAVPICSSAVAAAGAGMTTTSAETSNATGSSTETTSSAGSHATSKAASSASGAKASATDSAASASSSVVKGAAARETGFVMVVGVVAAGFMAAVAAL
ncbi:Uu.00g020920.m01.CDS01 [Anthostomella pinea]|uniref:Uu.00g020920.m01.CDS01 n=1 Tax=Anthostomella pinea TaxID=933095 RepID=A0AAI8VZK8_9PEZI|nr:Uu.00g020920.m01.CDS01 [Anthostomella pinea]